MIGFALCAVCGYLLGSLNFGVIISKYKYHEDVRSKGSGNAGTTNMMRTYGKSAAVFTLVGDMSKAVVAVMLGTLFNGNMGAYLAALLCVVGHAYPVFFKFKGGKGVAVTAAALLCLNPIVFAILLLIFVIVVAFTKYVSLASIMCMLVYPLILYRMSGSQLDAIPMVCAILNSALVIFLHRSNIKRLMEGTENKFSFKSKDKSKSEAGQVKPSDGAGETEKKK